ncbi:MAG: RrF2 family transcriptional regulator [Leadbetterella sp.]
MISKKAKYALKALSFLAKDHDAVKPYLISEIAEKEHIPKKFLESILLQLKNDGILKSLKGKGGGYLLRLPPNEIVLAKVIRIIDGPIAPVPCVSLHFYERCDDCKDEEYCALRPIMEKIRDANLSVYENTYLSDLLN